MMCKKTQLDLCCAPIIPALQRLTQEEHEFKANLSYTVRACFKTIKIKSVDVFWYLMEEC